VRFLVSLTVVTVIADIVVATAAELLTSPPLGREAIQRTSLRTNGTYSVVFENDKSHEQQRDDADTKPDRQVSACPVGFHRAICQIASYTAQRSDSSVGL
jgi:hypothetical protein